MPGWLAIKSRQSGLCHSCAGWDRLEKREFIVYSLLIEVPVLLKVFAGFADWGRRVSLNHNAKIRNR